MAACLEVQEILLHPFVIGELAMGSMPQYDATLASLNNLQQIEVARPDDVLHLIREHRLMGTGIGYVDAHLLASAKLFPGTQLWTRDRRLRQAAEVMGLASALS
jgi:hypothetical protein